MLLLDYAREPRTVRGDFRRECCLSFGLLKFFMVSILVNKQYLF